MKRFVHLLETTVRRVPVFVLVGTIVLTLVFGFFIPQQEMASGNEGFSPDSEEFLAAQTVADEFDTSAIAPVQVVFTAEGGDVITADALRTYVAVEQAIGQSRAQELLTGQPQGDIQGFFLPALAGLEQMGVAPAEATDEQVKQAYLAGLEALPEDVVGQATLTLSSENTDLSVPSSSAGLMIVLLDTSVLEDDPDLIQLQEIQVDMAEDIEAAQQGGTVSARPFSFALLFSDSDEFQSEIGRLFGTAFLIILLILGFVFWTKPSGRMTRLRSLRRAAADVLLALGVIIMSITWMNGIGVLLGPKYLGLIGNFSEILQIIPILLVGLGVDYAIHLTSRYREELGAGTTDVDTAAARATRTVGVALVLATVTTVVGFLTNIISPVTAIADFGILAAVGIAAAFVLMLTFVPAVRILVDRRAEAKGTLPADEMNRSDERLLPKLMGRAAIFAERIPVVMLVLALAFGGLGVYGLLELDTEFSFTDFLPEDSPMLETFDVLSEEFGGGLGETTNVLIEGDGVLTPEVHNGIVAAWGNMADTEAVLSFGPQAAAQSPVSVIAQLMTPPDQGGTEELYSPDFAATADELGLQPDLTVTPATDVAALYAAAEEAAPEAMRRVLTEGPDGTLINVAVSTQGGEGGARELAAGLREDFEPVSSIDGVSAVPSNENIISAGVVDALQSSQASSLAITLLAAMALLVINFLVEVRRPLLGVITIAPVALVVLWVFGMMAATGISFNPVTAMIAAIAIGIGVPYTIHVTHRYQEDRIRYESPEEAIRSTMTHTGGALAGSAFTTVAGFGILVTSSLKPFQQLGLVTAYAIGFAMIAAVLVLPSMLMLWDRWHRRRGDAILDAERFEQLFEESGVTAKT